jgi:hypothetical protein
MGGQLLNPRERHPLTRQQPLDPVGVPAAIAPREQELAMHLAPILFGEGRHVDDAPDLLLAAGRADEHRHQLARIEAIRLRPSSAPIHFDARGVDDVVGDPAAHEIAMKPEPVAPGLVAASHWCAGRQPEVRLRPSDLRLERRELTGRHRAHERRLIDPGGHRELPLSVAELEGER